MLKIMAEKLWQDHIVKGGENGAPELLYTDLYLFHEATSSKLLQD